MLESYCCHRNHDSADDRQEGYGRQPVHIAQLSGEIQYEAQYRAAGQEYDGAGSMVGEDVHLGAVSGLAASRSDEPSHVP